MRGHHQRTTVSSLPILHLHPSLTLHLLLQFYHHDIRLPAVDLTEEHPTFIG